jgi:hypothetical protein
VVAPGESVVLTTKGEKQVVISFIGDAGETPTITATRLSSRPADA